jgi:hypothetical protein
MERLSGGLVLVLVAGATMRLSSKYLPKGIWEAVAFGKETYWRVSKKGGIDG